MDNDVNLATTAERRHGSGADADGFALMWPREGLGLGIDLGGTLLRGARGGAGEIGYLPFGPGGSDLQALIGGAAVRRLAAEHGHPGDTTAAAAANAAGDQASWTPTRNASRWDSWRWSRSSIRPWWCWPGRSPRPAARRYETPWWRP